MSDAHESAPPEPAPTGTGAEDQITVAVAAGPPGAVIVTVSGEVDMLTSPQLRRTVLEQLAVAGTALVVLSLDTVTFLGTSGLAALIEFRDAARSAGIELRLACTGRRVLRPLMIAGLTPMFDIRDTVDAALAPA